MLKRICISSVLSILVSWVASFCCLSEISFYTQETTSSFADSLGVKILFWMLFFCLAFLPLFIFYVRSNDTEKKAFWNGFAKLVQMYVSILISIVSALFLSWISAFVLWGMKADENAFATTITIVFFGVLLLVFALMMILLVFRGQKRK